MAAEPAPIKKHHAHEDPMKIAGGAFPPARGAQNFFGGRQFLHRQTGLPAEEKIHGPQPELRAPAGEAGLRQHKIGEQPKRAGPQRRLQPRRQLRDRLRRQAIEKECGDHGIVTLRRRQPRPRVRAGKRHPRAIHRPESRGGASQHAWTGIHTMQPRGRRNFHQARKTAAIALADQQNLPALAQLLQKTKSRPFQLAAKGDVFKAGVNPGQPAEFRRGISAATATLRGNLRHVRSGWSGVGHGSFFRGEWIKARGPR